MPYIRQAARYEIETKYKIPENAGELNFELTMCIRRYLEEHGKSYAIMNDIIGALECCKLEFARRVINDYENLKITENGDCY